MNSYEFNIICTPSGRCLEFATMTKETGGVSGACGKTSRVEHLAVWSPLRRVCFPRFSVHPASVQQSRPLAEVERLQRLLYLFYRPTATLSCMRSWHLELFRDVARTLHFGSFRTHDSWLNVFCYFERHDEHSDTKEDRAEVTRLLLRDKQLEQLLRLGQHQTLSFHKKVSLGEGLYFWDFGRIRMIISALNQC